MCGVVSFIIGVLFHTGCVALAVTSSCRIPSGSQFESSKYTLIYSSHQRLFPRTAFDGNWYFHPGIEIPDNLRIRSVCNKDIYGDATHKSTVSRCQNGVWSPALPQCAEFSDCGVFPYRRAYATERRRVGVTYPHGHVITFTCIRGQRMFGNDTIMCEDGNWTDVNFRCLTIEKGCFPLEVAEATIVHNHRHRLIRGKYRSGTTLQFECLAGKELVGDNSVVCNKGAWSEVQFVCVRPPQALSLMEPVPLKQASPLMQASPLKQASPPKQASPLKQAPLIEISLPPIGVPTSCSIPTGSTYTDAMFSPLLSVHRGIFPDSDFDGNDMFKSGVNIPNDIHIKMVCKNETVEHNFTCMDGQWTPALPNCTELPLTLDLPQERALHSCSIPTGSIYTGAMFSPLLSVHRGIFPDSDFDSNDLFKAGASIPNDIHIKMVCKNETVEHNFTCMDGQWTPALPNCTELPLTMDFPIERALRSCNIPTGSNYIKAMFSPLLSVHRGIFPDSDFDGNDLFKAGASIPNDIHIKMVCKNETVEHNSTCMDGQWTPALPNCTAERECRKIKVKGAIAYTETTLRALLNSFSSGTVLNFECKKGKTMTGNNTVVCNDGEWSPVNFTCKRTRKQTSPGRKTSRKRPKGCQRLDIMGAYLTSKRPRYRHGTEVTYKCRPRHKLIGDGQLTCTNGGWSEVRFFCLPIKLQCRSCAKYLLTTNSENSLV